IAYYNIYRETSQKGVYQQIGSRNVDSLSIFVDSVADPTIRSWKYKISAVDVCGNESELSDHHKTIHLTMNVGIGNTVNLIWDHYEGFVVNQYRIMRYSTAAGWERLDSLSSDNTSYTDMDPPDDEDLFYMIEVDHPGGGCTATESKASTYNTVRSNRVKTTKAQSTGISNLPADYYLNIYPNPAGERITIEIGKVDLGNVLVEMIDINGQICYQKELYPAANYMKDVVGLNSMPKGFYILRIRFDNNTLFRKVIIQ
ncbi:MAG: T9SS type A sorting domain-containing protein, partial [Bacteroidales bacterium]